MKNNKTSTTLIILGALGIIAAFLVDIIRNSKLQIQAAQILLIELSILTILLGLLTRQIFTNHSNKNSLDGLVKWIKEIPQITWAMAGFLIAYVAFFIIPVFFNTPPRMQYFNKYLPDSYPIGGDLLFMTNLAKSWFEEGQSPFYVQFYPPFTYVFFSPFILIADQHLLFKIVTITTIACFILSSLLIPLLISKDKEKALIWIFFVTGLISYGMQFELERGQINVITFLFCISAIYIYHFHHSFRYYAYLLFSTAIQIKIYPAIFIVMFIKDWRDWKGNLRRIIVLGLFNFSLLFIAGVQPFLEFTSSVTNQITNPGWSWVGNHSIKAFVSEFVENNGFGLAQTSLIEFIQQHIGAISSIFLIIYLLCFLSAILRAYRNNHEGIDAILFLTCMIGALIIPVSNDYTLSILAAPSALALTAISNGTFGKNKISAILLLMLASAAYTSTLYPFKHKPLLLQNSFTALFIVLIATTLLNHIVASVQQRAANDKKVIFEKQ